MNPDSFKTSQMLVSNLSKIGFPVLISIVGKYSSYNHVVVVWKNKIFDFKHEYPYELTEANVDIAGKNNHYHKLVRGYGILPLKSMKKKNTDYSDWGKG